MHIAEWAKRIRKCPKHSKTSQAHGKMGTTHVKMPSSCVNRWHMWSYDTLLQITPHPLPSSHSLLQRPVVIIPPDKKQTIAPTTVTEGPPNSSTVSYLHNFGICVCANAVCLSVIRSDARVRMFLYVVWQVFGQTANQVWRFCQETLFPSWVISCMWVYPFADRGFPN
jgi:hypothetical protein